MESRRGLFSQQEMSSGTFELYRPPPADDVQRLDAQMHWFSYYRKWVPQEKYYYAVQHTGFQANPGRSEGTYSKYASLDDRMDGFHFYLAYVKVGIARATSDAAHEIRDGHITREEGVALVHRYDGECPKKYFREFLDDFDITEGELFEVVEFYRSRAPHLWEKRDGGWDLKHRVQTLSKTEEEDVSIHDDVIQQVR